MGKLIGTRAYLAGAIDRDPTSGKTWRDSISEWLVEHGVIVFNPLDKPIDIGIENTENVEERKLWKRDEQYELITHHMKEIRHVDLRMVDNVDFLIVNIDVDIHACGTYEELTWANRCKKPIIIHCEQGKSKAPDWLFGTVPHEMIFSSWEEVKHYLYTIDVGIDRRTFGRWTFFNLAKPTLFSLLMAAEYDKELEQLIMDWKEKKGRER